MRKELLALALLAGVAHAGERYEWSRVAVVESVAITVTKVDTIKLASLMGVGDVHSLIDKGGRESRHGFAVLKRNRATGAYSCQIFMVDPTDAATLEHETKHCYGWKHP